MKSISQKLQDDIRAIMEASLHPNQQKIDVHEPEKDKITADDFKMLRAMKKSKPMKEDPDWVIIEQDEDNTTAKVAGHKVTLHRSLSKPGMSDTYTLHHPSGDKKVTISYDTHGDGEEVHGDKVNKAFGLDSKHKLGHKIAGSMSGMGGISKFEESVEQTNEEEKKKPVSPFDYKNYKSQIPKKPGELTGHDSKKTSTGTVYTKRPVKENTEVDEARKLEGTYTHTNGNQSKVYKLSGEHHEGDPYHVKLFKAGKHYEPADYFTNDKEDAHGTAKHMVKEAVLSLSTSSSLLNEYKKDKPNDIESSAYTPEKNSDGKTLTTRLYAKEYKNRAAQHEKDLNRKNATPEDKKEDKGHMERANAAHEAHTHAINVHHSPTASPNEKQDAVKKAVHAQLKYWKHGPMSHTDARSDRGEQDYYTSHKRYLEHPDMKSIKEEVEELDELPKTTLGSYAKKATRDAVITRKIGADFEHQSKRAKSPGMKAASDELSQKWKEKSWKRRDGVDKAVDRLTKEDVEQEEYTFADYLDAVRTQYGDEDAVLIANEAFKNQDITLFIDQSQSPEA